MPAGEERFFPRPAGADGEDPLAGVAGEPGWQVPDPVAEGGAVDMVGRFIARRVSDPHTVADLTADVFLAAIASSHSYRPERGSVAAWLHGVARHVVASEFRRRAREHDAAQRAGGRRALVAEDIARIEERVDAEKSARRTYEALSALPEPTRQLIELIAVDGLTVTEAAAALGVTPLVARVRLHRARKVLQAIAGYPLSTPASRTI